MKTPRPTNIAATLKAISEKYGPNSKELKHAFGQSFRALQRTNNAHPNPAIGSRPPTNHSPQKPAIAEEDLSPESRLLLEHLRQEYFPSISPYEPPSAIGRAVHTMRHSVSRGLDYLLTKIGTLLCILHLSVKQYRLSLYHKAPPARTGTALPDTPAR